MTNRDTQIDLFINMMNLAARQDTRRHKAYVGYIVADARKAPLDLNHFDAALAASKADLDAARAAFNASVEGCGVDYLADLAMEAARKMGP